MVSVHAFYSNDLILESHLSQLWLFLANFREYIVNKSSVVLFRWLWIVLMSKYLGREAEKSQTQWKINYMAIKYMKKNDYLINTGSERERELGGGREIEKKSLSCTFEQFGFWKSLQKLL